jgi:hypothetical protein
MGCTLTAKCLDCGESFTVDDGGGFCFHLLRCDRCGVERSVGFEELGLTHIRYLKGLSGPYCIASMEHDEWVRKNAPVEPLSEGEYHKSIEEQAGSCRCGGRYALDAPPRCPKCRSARIKQGELVQYYD